MNRIFTFTLLLCILYVSVESKPLILDKLQSAASGVTCAVVNLGKCPKPTTEAGGTVPTSGTNVDTTKTDEEEDEEDRRIIQSTTCQAGYRSDRQGNCRRIA